MTRQDEGASRQRTAHGTARRHLGYCSRDGEWGWHDPSKTYRFSDVEGLQYNYNTQIGVAIIGLDKLLASLFDFIVPTCALVLVSKRQGESRPNRQAKSNTSTSSHATVSPVPTPTLRAPAPTPTAPGSTPAATARPLPEKGAVGQAARSKINIANGMPERGSQVSGEVSAEGGSSTGVSVAEGVAAKVKAQEVPANDGDHDGTDVADAADVSPTVKPAGETRSNGSGEEEEDDGDGEEEDEEEEEGSDLEEDRCGDHHARFDYCCEIALLFCVCMYRRRLTQGSYSPCLVVSCILYLVDSIVLSVHVQVRYLGHPKYCLLMLMMLKRYSSNRLF